MFIGIDKEPSITLSLSLHIMNTLGHIYFLILLYMFPYRTITEMSDFELMQEHWIKTPKHKCSLPYV